EGAASGSHRAPGPAPPAPTAMGFLHQRRANRVVAPPSPAPRPAEGPAPGAPPTHSARGECRAGSGSRSRSTGNAGGSTGSGGTAPGPQPRDRSPGQFASRPLVIARREPSAPGYSSSGDCRRSAWTDGLVPLVPAPLRAIGVPRELASSPHPHRVHHANADLTPAGQAS